MCSGQRVLGRQHPGSLVDQLAPRHDAVVLSRVLRATAAAGLPSRPPAGPGGGVRRRPGAAGAAAGAAAEARRVYGAGECWVITAPAYHAGACPRSPSLIAPKRCTVDQCVSDHATNLFLYRTPWRRPRKYLTGNKRRAVILPVLLGPEKDMHDNKSLEITLLPTTARLVLKWSTMPETCWRNCSLLLPRPTTWWAPCNATWHRPTPPRCSRCCWRPWTPCHGGTTAAPHGAAGRRAPRRACGTCRCCGWRITRRGARRHGHRRPYLARCCYGRELPLMINS